MGSDEADLGDGAFLVDASYARELAQLPPQDETAQQVGGDTDGSSGVGESGAGDSGTRKALAGTRLSLLFRVGKSELFDSMQVLATLSDESDVLDVAMRVEATAKESFDQTWVRNAIRERLEEAGIDVTADLSSDSDAT
jgi:hypothetical protein